MPKIVDPNQRRREVTDAVFRVVMREGLTAASLRAVADEAGLAVGSVRHYFADHAAIMTFALRELTERTAERIVARAEVLLAGEHDPATRYAAIEAVMAEFLPLDKQRRLEVVVWLEFATAARTNPILADDARRIHDGMRTILRRFLDGAAEAERLAPSLDLEVETERLAALLDGLAMTMVLRPDRATEEGALAVVRRHLDSLRNG